MNMEKFIDMVRNHPALYDHNHPDYTNKAVRCNIWKRITRDCDFSNEKAAKVEWKRLRDTFRLTLKPNGKKNTKVWKYTRQMRFLTPFMNHKDKQTEGFHETPEVSIFEHVLAPNMEEQYYINDEVSVEPPRLKQLTIDEEPMIGSLNITSSLDHFFLSMCETTKNLPGNLQTQVKRKVFQAVIEAEEAFEQAKGFGFTQVSECNSSSNYEDWPSLYVETEDSSIDHSKAINHSKEKLK